MRRGGNLFDDGSDAGSELLRQAIGGLQQAMPDSLAFFAPNVNAFRRFGPMQFVPLNRFWGYNNRAVAFRVPAGPRPRGGSSIASPAPMPIPIWCWRRSSPGMHHGITTKADPGEPRQGSAACEMPAMRFDLATRAQPPGAQRAARPLFRSRLSQGLCRGEAQRARPLPRSHRAARIRLVSVSVARELLAWYDRHRRGLPWRAPAGRARRSLSRLAQRDHAAADDGRDRRALFRRLHRSAGRMSRRWPRPSSTRCSMPGRGLAITRGRAICIACARVVVEQHGGGFPDTEEGLRACRASAPIRRRRSRPSPSTARHAGRRQCRAGDGAAVRRDRAAAGRQAGDFGAWPRR